jgi:hypothetical protein
VPEYPIVERKPDWNKKEVLTQAQKDMLKKEYSIIGCSTEKEALSILRKRFKGKLHLNEKLTFKAV